MAKVKNKISSSREDKIFNVIIHIIIATLLIIVAYPLIFVLSSSFSSKEAVTNGLVFLWPVDFSIEGYVTVFQKPDVLIGYRNTIIYTVVGTMLNLVLTMIAFKKRPPRRQVPHLDFHLYDDFQRRYDSYIYAR